MTNYAVALDQRFRANATMTLNTTKSNLNVLTKKAEYMAIDCWKFPFRCTQSAGCRDDDTFELTVNLTNKPNPFFISKYEQWVKYCN